MPKLKLNKDSWAFRSANHALKSPSHNQSTQTELQQKHQGTQIRHIIPNITSHKITSNTQTTHTATKQTSTQSAQTDNTIETNPPFFTHGEIYEQFWALMPHFQEYAFSLCSCIAIPEPIRKHIVETLVTTFYQIGDVPPERITPYSDAPFPNVCNSYIPDTYLGYQCYATTNGSQQTTPH